MSFSKHFAKVLRTPILQNTEGRVFLKYLLKVKIAAPARCGNFEGKKEKYGKQSGIQKRTLVLGKEQFYKI